MRLAAVGLGALLGAVLGLALLAFVVMLAQNWWDWWTISLVITFSAPAVGLVGCFLGAIWGMGRQPRARPAPADNWAAPDTAEVQRVVAGRVIESDPNSP